MTLTHAHAVRAPAEHHIAVFHSKYETNGEYHRCNRFGTDRLNKVISHDDSEDCTCKCSHWPGIKGVDPSDLWDTYGA
jgi:hypothetical protein